QVSMDQRSPVRGGQSGAELAHNRVNLIAGQRGSAVQLFAQRSSLQSLHDQKRPAVRHQSHIEQRNHVRVLEARKDTCLALKAIERCRICDQVLRNQLNGYPSLQLQVDGFIDRAHTSLPNFGFQSEPFLGKGRREQRQTDRDILEQTNVVGRVRLLGPLPAHHNQGIASTALYWRDQIDAGIQKRFSLSRGKLTGEPTVIRGHLHGLTYYSRKFQGLAVRKKRGRRCSVGINTQQLICFLATIMLDYGAKQGVHRRL